MEVIKNIEANAALVAKKVELAKTVKAAKNKDKAAKVMDSSVYLLEVIASRSAAGKYTFAEHALLNVIRRKVRKLHDEGHITRSLRDQISNIVWDLRAQAPKRFNLYGFISAVTTVSLSIAGVAGLGFLFSLAIS